MRFSKSLYVFSFIFIFITCLSNPGFAQKKNSKLKGLATWYGTHFHGKKTTSGEVYNKHSMTAAHLSLPFGTKVKVTNQNTKKSVIVRINDRGPWGNKKRIIDLSEAAARKIDVYAEGMAEVTVEVIPPGSASVKPRKQKSKLKALAITKAKVKPKAPVVTPEPAPYQPNALTFAVQGSVYLPQPNPTLLNEIIKIDLRQPLAVREEEMHSYWAHQMAVNQIVYVAQTEIFLPTIGLEEGAGLSLLKPGAS